MTRTGKFSGSFAGLVSSARSLFHRRHVFVQRVGGDEHVLGASVLLVALFEFGELRSQVAHVVNGLIRLTGAARDVRRQFELLSKIGGGGLIARIGTDLERDGVLFAGDGEACSVRGLRNVRPR